MKVKRRKNYGNFVDELFVVELVGELRDAAS